MELKISQQPDDITRLALSGRLDTAAALEFESEFAANASAPGKPCIVDLAGLTFISSMGIRMLLSAAIELNRRGSKMALLNLPAPAEKAVRAAGLDMVMRVARREEEAVEFLKHERSAEPERRGETER